MSNREPLRLDPYFQGGTQPRANRTYAQSPPGYHDIAAEPPLNIEGRHPSTVMRPGRFGLRGTVVPKATNGGIPQGTRPHAVADMTLVIDPNTEGVASSRVNLRDLNSRVMAAAAARAEEEAPSNGTTEDIRLFGSTAMHEVNNMAQAVPVPQQRTVTAAAAPQQAVSYGSPMAGMQEARPLRSFFQPAAPAPSEPYREARSIMLDEGRGQQAAQPPQPTVEVIFEIDGFGQHTALYHHVIATEGHVVLVLRSDWRSGRFFPRPSSQQMALMLANQPEIYLVQTTGVQYSYAGNDFCLLLVEKVADSRQVPASPTQG
jgi:hypothetical protein